MPIIEGQALETPGHEKQKYGQCPDFGRQEKLTLCFAAVIEFQELIFNDNL